MRPYCQILIFFVAFVGVSTLEVQQTPTITHAVSVGAAPQHRTLQHVSLSLDKGGSKTFDAEQLPDTSKDRGSIQKPDFLTNDVKQAASTGLRARDSHTALVAGMFLWVLVAVFMLGAWTGNVFAEQGDNEGSIAPVQVEQPLSARVAANQGSWACKFRESHGKEKEALALLLKCNVISNEEFCKSNVSQEHIDECLWIAKTMLKQRPIEDWLALSQGQNGRQAFEASVAAVFQDMARVMEVPNNQAPLCSLAADKQISKSFLEKSSSAVSLGGSDVTFLVQEEAQRWPEEPEREISPASVCQFPPNGGTPTLAWKSPVPRLDCVANCDMESSVASASTHADEQMEEPVFASLFSSFQSSAVTSPQLSLSSSPQESLFERSPNFLQRDTPSMRLQSRQTMAPSPPAMQRTPNSTDSGGQTLQRLRSESRILQAREVMASPPAMQRITESPVASTTSVRLAYKSPPEPSKNPRVLSAPSGDILTAAHSVVQESYESKRRAADGPTPKSDNSPRLSCYSHVSGGSATTVDLR